MRDGRGEGPMEKAADKIIIAELQNYFELKEMARENVEISCIIEDINTLLSWLEPNIRAAVYYRWMVGMDADEAARACKCSRSKLYNLLEDAKKEFREQTWICEY